MKNNGQPLPEVLNLKETATFLRLSEKIVQDLASSGKIPGRLVADQWRFSRTNLQEWLRGEVSRRVSLPDYISPEDADAAWDEVRAIIHAERKGQKKTRARG